MATNDEIDAVIEIFRGEARELLQSIGDEMLKLEKASTVEQRRDIAGVAFRYAHSVKGAAGSLGFIRVEQLVHALEDLLSSIRSGQTEPRSDIMDLVLMTLDAVAELVAVSAPGDNQLEESDRLLQNQLHAVLKGEQPSGSRAQHEREHSRLDSPIDPTPVASRDAPPSDGFIRISQRKLDTLLAQVTELTEMRVRMEEMFRQVRVVQDDLKQLGAKGADRPAQSLRLLSRGMHQDLKFLRRLLAEIQDELKELRMVPINTIFPVLRRAVRDVCRKRALEIHLILEGGELELDRKIVEELKTPLVHLLRNAAGHGIEQQEVRAAAGKPMEGLVELHVIHQGSSLRLEVTDDGRGVDLEHIHRCAVDLGLYPRSADRPTSAELLRLLFSAGMSTSPITDTVSGRGVGLAAVKQIIQKLHGTISVDSREGRGTTFAVTVPLTLATDTGLYLLSGETRFVIPRTAVQRVLAFGEEDVCVINDTASLWHDNQHIPVVYLDQSLRCRPFAHPGNGRQNLAVILRSAEVTGAVVVDGVEGEAEVVVRSLGSLVEHLENISGLTISASGDIHFVLNPSDLLRSMLRPLAGSGQPEPLTSARGVDASASSDKVILVVDDSVSSRVLNQKLLAGSGFQVITAVDAQQALQVLRSHHVDLVLTDVQMPHMDGYQLTAHIKQDPNLSHIPVILLTARDRREEKERGLEVGADAYLIKRDVSQSLLVSTIEQLI